MNIFEKGWDFLQWYTGIPKEQLKCKHPSYARDYRLRLDAEENANDYYEECQICGKEFHA